MENKRCSLLTIFLVITIILIMVMGVFMYMQKTKSDRQINELEDNVIRMQETINNLQGKIDTISKATNLTNTSKEDNTQENGAIYDVEIQMSELENVNYADNAQLKALEDKYKGKIVKITGYVSNFGDDDLDTERTYVNIGNSSTYKNKVYASRNDF